MTTFDERERAFEAHFALEQEQEFKAFARRDRQLGLWAGGLMGLEGGALEGYAASLVREDVRAHGDDEVFRKVRSDLTASGVQVRDSAIHSEMDRLLAHAREELRAGN